MAGVGELIFGCLGVHQTGCSVASHEGTTYLNNVTSDLICPSSEVADALNR